MMGRLFTLLFDADLPRIDLRGNFLVFVLTSKGDTNDVDGAGKQSDAFVRVRH